MVVLIKIAESSAFLPHGCTQGNLNWSTLTFTKTDLSEVHVDRESLSVAAWKKKLLDLWKYLEIYQAVILAKSKLKDW